MCDEQIQLWSGRWVPRVGMPIVFVAGRTVDDVTVEADGFLLLYAPTAEQQFSQVDAVRFKIHKSPSLLEFVQAPSVLEFALREPLDWARGAIDQAALKAFKDKPHEFSCPDSELTKYDDWLKEMMRLRLRGLPRSIIESLSRSVLSKDNRTKLEMVATVAPMQRHG